MEGFLLNLLKNSLLGALVIAAMLATKPLWRERYGARARCWLWLALAVFLLLPLDLSVEDAPVQLAPPKDYTVLVAGEKTTVQATDALFGELAESRGQTGAQVRDELLDARSDTLTALTGDASTIPQAAQAQRYLPVSTLLFLLWAAGAALFLLWQAAVYFRFRATVRRWKRDTTRADYAALLVETTAELGVRAPRMLICEAVTTPAVTGVFRPMLLLPHESYTTHELRFILRHELCHLKRRDMLLKLALLAANAMHWFDPVVYLMLRQADEDIELACDSAATQGMDRAERADYSRALLAAVTVKRRTVPATTCFGGTVERLKRRITNVLGAQKKRGLGLVALVLAMTLAAGCATGWGGGTQNNTPDDTDTDARYESMEDYFDERITEMKNGTMLYYVEESADYPDGVTDQVADARMTDVVQHASLEGLASAGAVLELWSYRYERKPVNEKGLTVMLVGGQMLSDDGYLDDGFTTYLFVLHNAAGENAGYEIIGSERSNDGLWYNGGSYGGFMDVDDGWSACLHDFYVDYAGLDTPKYYIPDLLGGTVTDGYGREDLVEAQLIQRDGYYFYVPYTAWDNNAGTEFWYSLYHTGSYFTVHLREQSIEDAAAEWSATGAEKTAFENGYRFVTSEGMSNSVIYLIAAPNNAQHYEISTRWEYDGSADNEWGWNHDRAVEQESAILAAMANSFRVTASEDYEPSFTRDLDLASSEDGAAALELWETGSDGKNTSFGNYIAAGTWYAPKLNGCTYAAADAADVPTTGLRLTLWLANNDSSHFTFYEGTNLVSYHRGGNDPVEYYMAQDDFSVVDGDGRTIFNTLRAWYDEAELAALRDDLPQIYADTWEVAAQNWADEFFGIYTQTTSGSQYHYTWSVTTIEPAPEATEMLREMGDIGENEYCFSTTTKFVPGNDDARNYSMAGNTADCTDPTAPEGAMEYYRCCTVRLDEDGLWHGTMWGTGW